MTSWRDRVSQRDRLVQRVAKSIVWRQAQEFERDNAKRLASQVVDDLLNGSAEGKATELAVKTILTSIEKSA